MTLTPYPADWLGAYRWQGLDVSFMAAPGPCLVDAEAAADPGDPRPAAVVLIHGFGACKEHWRHNVAALSSTRAVYALDLIGFGASSKPRSCLAHELPAAGSLRYGIDLWAAQVVAFLTAQQIGTVQLVGNSIGGVVALAAASRLETEGRPCRGVVLIDCAQRALDEKRLAEQPALLRWTRPGLKSLVRQRWLTELLFRSLARPGVIRRVLRQAYPSGANVDEQLVELLLRPALQPGASEAFRGFINLFEDRLAPDLLATLSTPVRMIWGQQDPWEPIAEARRWTAFPCVRELHELPGLGHCPHDEAPAVVNPLRASARAEADRTG
jgi:pimeloyl-ACP methyl ester carboxylesterase